MAQLITAFFGKPPIAEIQIAQLWLVGDEVPGRVRSPGQKSRSLHRGSLTGPGMWGCDEDHLSGAGKKVGNGWIVSLLIGGAQNLLDDQAAKTMADENDRASPQVGVIQQ